MHYRMESLGDELVIRNVETNRRAGTVVPFCIVHWHDPDRREIRGCDVFNNQGDKLARIIVEGPLGKAAVAVANYEAAYPPRWKRKSCSTEFNKSSVYGVLGVGQNSLGQWVTCRNGCHLVDGKRRFA